MNNIWTLNVIICFVLHNYIQYYWGNCPTKLGNGAFAKSKPRGFYYSEGVTGVEKFKADNQYYTPDAHVHFQEAY